MNYELCEVFFTPKKHRKPENPQKELVFQLDPPHGINERFS